MLRQSNPIPHLLIPEVVVPQSSQLGKFRLVCVFGTLEVFFESTRHLSDTFQMLMFDKYCLALSFGMLYTTIFVCMVFCFAELAGHLDWFGLCSFVLS